jgi:hypothetical protein
MPNLFAIIADADHMHGCFMYIVQQYLKKTFMNNFVMLFNYKNAIAFQPSKLAFRFCTLNPTFIKCCLYYGKWLL